MTIALGEVQSGRVTYIPDNIVVIFDPRDAQRYQPAASPTGALGTPLAQPE